jgi:bifunctional DNase/RNase
VFINGDDTIEIDSRTSDAIAMAVRFECPIFVAQNILDEAGVDGEQGALLDSHESEEELIEKTIEELTSMPLHNPSAGAANYNALSE